MPKKRKNSPDPDIRDMKVGDLKRELSSRGLDSTGKKADLVDRLEKAKQAAPPAKKAKVEASTSTTSSSVDYSKMGVADLKKELLSKGLKATGKKADLVERLQAAASGSGGKEEQPKEEEHEETEFSKAKRALAAETESKKKSKAVKKQRKVDPHVPDADEWEVVDDWDCMLNQTLILGNNNKFYVIQLLRHKRKNSYNLWTRWGRVGENGQHVLGAADDLEKVKKEFKKKFRSKTRNKWEDRHHFKPEPFQYAMVDVEEDEEGDLEEMKAKLQELDEPDDGPAPTVLPCTLDPPTQSLMKTIFGADIFAHTLTSMELDIRKMPMGKLSKAQITKGIEALEAVEKGIDMCVPRETLGYLSSTFYSIIPHDFGRRIPPVIADKEALQKKFDMLSVLGDLEMAQDMQKVKVKAKATEVPHELDAKYSSLKCDLVLLDSESEEFKMVYKYMAATSEESAKKILEVWKVDRHNVDDRFKVHDHIKNRRLLWHGTRAGVVPAILNSGLRIMPYSGGVVGRGIYHASEYSRSSQFVRSSPDGLGFAFLNEVALGKEHPIVAMDQTITTPPDGFDCVIGRGSGEPDPRDDIVVKMGGHDVTVPLGKPVPSSFTNSWFHQSEYLVYKESQTRIRYMVKFIK